MIHFDLAIDLISDYYSKMECLRKKEILLDASAYE